MTDFQADIIRLVVNEFNSRVKENDSEITKMSKLHILKLDIGEALLWAFEGYNFKEAI